VKIENPVWLTTQPALELGRTSAQVAKPWAGEAADDTRNDAT
jgi:hypothetical protein